MEGWIEKGTWCVCVRERVRKRERGAPFDSDDHTPLLHRHRYQMRRLEGGGRMTRP